MKRWTIFFIAAIPLGLAYAVWSAESTKYPPPRFPSYVKPPKSIEDVMPFARAAVRQTGGRTPLGLVEKGTVLIVAGSTADEMVMRAIGRAYGERGVKVQIIPEYELAGLKREEAQKAKEVLRDYTSEKGYMEAARWIQSRFADPEVPKKWLRERRPDLYKAMFETEGQTSDQLKTAAQKLSRKGLSEGLIKYLDQHPEVNGVFFQRGGRTATSRVLQHHSPKFLGNFISIIAGS
jgi:hypothetical protein